MKPEIIDRMQQLFEMDTSIFASSNPAELEDIGRYDHSSCFAKAEAAYDCGTHGLLLEEPDWRDWFAKSARYRMQGLERYEAEYDTTKPVEYDNALCGAILSENATVIQEVVDGINQMPDEVHELGNIHGEVVRDTIRCQAHLIEGDSDATESALETAQEMFQTADEENGLDLVETDRAPRFPATFQFIRGLLDDDRETVEDAVNQLLEWHDTELFEEKTSDYFAHWPAMYVVLANHFGYEIRPEHEHLPSHFLDAIGEW